MKVVALKNEAGETIEVTWDDDGSIQVRHSDIDKHLFGRFCEFGKQANLPKFREFMASKGMDLENPLLNEMLASMGGYLEIDGQIHWISSSETKMIVEAVIQNGGIVPNWASQD